MPLVLLDVAEYVIPCRARALLLRVDEVESNAAMNKFQSLLRRLPLVLKSADISQQVLDARSSEKRTAILKEVPCYLALAEGVDFHFPLLEFWNTHRDSIPNLFDLFIIIGTLEASSAPAERVFSKWQLQFGSAEIVDASEEYMETAMMAQCNK